MLAATAPSRLVRAHGNVVNRCTLRCPATATSNRHLRASPHMVLSRKGVSVPQLYPRAMQPSAATVTQHALPPLSPLNGSYEGVHAFSEYANWLIPGALMLGRYPFVEPSRCLTRAQGENQLSVILEAGITTFVSLQAELPPQQEMRLAGVSGFQPYKATADLMRCTLNGPPPMEMVNGLRNQTLDKFLPSKRQKVAEEKKRIELKYLHRPVVDLGVPTMEQLQSLVQELEAYLKAGEVLYVHCWGGRGRSGLVGAALLMSAYGLTGPEALDRVQRAFDTRCDEGRSSPETDVQYAMIKDFERLLRP